MTEKQQVAWKAAINALDECRIVEGQEMAESALRLLRDAGDGWEPISEKHKDGKEWLVFGFKDDGSWYQEISEWWGKTSPKFTAELMHGYNAPPARDAAPTPAHGGQLDD